MSVSRNLGKKSPDVSETPVESYCHLDSDPLSNVVPGHRYPRYDGRRRRTSTVPLLTRVRVRYVDSQSKLDYYGSRDAFSRDPLTHYTTFATSKPLSTHSTRLDRVFLGS